MNFSNHVKKSIKYFSYFIVSPLVLSVSTANSANISWVGGSDTEWSNAGNWSDSQVPNSGDRVNIGAGLDKPAIISAGSHEVQKITVGSSSGQGTGSGKLIINNGASLTSTLDSAIGEAEGGTGIIEVTGPGSSLKITSGYFDMGRYGHAELTVSNGAKFDNSSDLYLFKTGSDKENTTSLITFTGQGTQGDIDDLRLSIIGSDYELQGHTKHESTLNVLDGAVLNVNYLMLAVHGNADLIIDDGTLNTERLISAYNEGTQSELTISGAEGVLNVTSELIYGKAGTGDLAILNAATMKTNRSLMGQESTGKAIVTVSGAGSVWEASGSTTLGNQGSASVTIENGGAMNSTGINAGVTASGRGDIIVTGKNSTLNNTGQFIIGNRGKGTLTITDSGSVTAGIVSLAVEQDSTGIINIGTGRSAGSLAATSITGGSGDATINFNHTDDIQFNAPMTGRLTVQHLNTGITTLFGDSTYTGKTEVQKGILKAGQDSVFSENSSYSVLENGAIDLNNYNQTTLALSLNGHLKFGDKPGTVLNVNQNYSGDGGNIYLAAALGDDNSLTDKLVVKGSASGKTTVHVKNVGGAGAQTINGIQIIEVKEPSDGDFKLKGDYIFKGDEAVVAGAFAYRLFHNGLGENIDDGNWYLRSELNDQTPHYQPGAPVYEAYSQFLLGLNQLPTLQQRMGNRYWDSAEKPSLQQSTDKSAGKAASSQADVNIEGNGIWGRIEGSHNKMNPRMSTSDATYDYSSYKMQAGLDGMLHEGENGKLIGGLTAQYIHGSANVWSPHNVDFNDSRIRSDGYGIGGTLTWYGDNGLYSDNQAQVTWHSSDLSYKGETESLGTGNHGLVYALSTELGKRFDLNDNWSVTPQGQLNYTVANFNDFTDVFGVDVSRERAANLRARLGVSLVHHNMWQSSQGMINRATLYGIANLYHEFLDGTRTKVAETYFINKSERQWGGIGVGGTYNWNDDKYSLYGEGSVNTSLNHFGDSYAYKGTLGFRMRW